MKKKSLISLIFFTVAVLIVFSVVLFGNAITLSVRSAKDLKVFNSGSLDVSGISYFETNENSDFANNLLKENKIIGDSDGDVVGTILPFLRFEIVKVNGVIFGDTVNQTKILKL